MHSSSRSSRGRHFKRELCPYRKISIKDNSVTASANNDDDDKTKYRTATQYLLEADRGEFF